MRPWHKGAGGSACASVHCELHRGQVEGAHSVAEVADKELRGAGCKGLRGLQGWAPAGASASASHHKGGARREVKAPHSVVIGVSEEDIKGVGWVDCDGVGSAAHHATNSPDQISACVHSTQGARVAISKVQHRAISRGRQTSHVVDSGCQAMHAIPTASSIAISQISCCPALRKVGQRGHAQGQQQQTQKQGMQEQWSPHRHNISSSKLTGHVLWGGQQLILLPAKQSK